MTSCSVTGIAVVLLSPSVYNEEPISLRHDLRNPAQNPTCPPGGIPDRNRPRQLHLLPASPGQTGRGAPETRRRCRLLQPGLLRESQETVSLRSQKRQAANPTARLGQRRIPLLLLPL